MFHDDGFHLCQLRVLFVRIYYWANDFWKETCLLLNCGLASCTHTCPKGGWPPSPEPWDSYSGPPWGISKLGKFWKLSHKNAIKLKIREPPAILPCTPSEDQKFPPPLILTLEHVWLYTTLYITKVVSPISWYEHEIFIRIECSHNTSGSARPNSCNIGMFWVPQVPYVLYRKVREQFVN